MDARGKIGRRNRVALAAGLLCLTLVVGAIEARGQAQVLVSYDGEWLPAVAMDGMNPVVQVGDRRYTVTDGTVRVVEAERFTDGAVEVLQRDAQMGQDYGAAYGAFFFRFEATVRAERDFEDCFILFVIAPELGEQSYVMRQISDIDVEGSERIRVTLPVNPGFGGGTFGYKLFSRGEEIRLIEPEEPVSITKIDESDASSPGSASPSPRRDRSGALGAGRPAEAVRPRLLQFPESLSGVASGGYAEAVYSVDRDGRAFEILDLQADREAFLPEVWKTVTETRYAPGIYEGEALVTTVRQRFFFNEFAPFSEEMVMISYPSINDREAQAVYAPLPEVELSRSERVTLQATIGLTGRPRELEVVAARNEELGRAALEKLAEWIFLPAVEDGFAVEQRVEIPLEFRPDDGR